MMPIGVEHLPEAIRLDRYPLLAHAPDQHGDFIATEDNGTPVDDIAAFLADGHSREEAADHFGTTPDHVKDAARFAEDHPPEVLAPRLEAFAAARARKAEALAAEAERAAAEQAATPPPTTGDESAASAASEA